MLFSNHNFKDQALQLTMENQHIIKTDWSKFLEIYIDEKLKWDIHTTKVKSRLASSLFAIDLNNYAPIRILATLYYSMVYPYLTYGITLWGATFRHMRAIVGAQYNTHTNNIFHQLGILKLDDIYKLNVGKFILVYIKKKYHLLW
jgi:hypothetical protein